MQIYDFYTIYQNKFQNLFTFNILLVYLLVHHLVMKKEKQSGIYKIVNVKNNKIYIGSARNLNKRWKRHICELNKKTHHNIILQNSWEKYGKDSFTFEVIEIVTDISLLMEREQYHINHFQPFGDKGYNISKNVIGCNSLENNPNRTDIISRISKSMKKVWENKTEEQKAALRMYGEKNPSWNGGSSTKLCKCGAKIAPVNKTCRKCLDFNGENNPFFGKKWTDEEKLNASNLRKSTYYGKQNKPVIIDNVEYKSIGDAGLALGVKKLTVRHRILSKNFPNYQYKKCES